MILGIGVDLLYLPRLKAVLSKHSPTSLARRILAKEELEEFHQNFPKVLEGSTESNALNSKALAVSEYPLPNDDMNQWRTNSEFTRWQRRGIVEANEQIVRYLGVRWCVKEAAFKALNPTWTVKWKDIILQKLEGGKPILATTEEIALNCNLTNSHVSISHDGDYIIAQVLFETEQDENKVQAVI